MIDKTKRILFAGTPDFALPSLEVLLQAGYQVVGVLTQPDKPGARGVLTPPPTKRMAEQYGIPVLQFAKVRLEGVEAIKALSPDIIITAAYGQIISQEIIDIPTYGVINVHGSMLPLLRGACPIQQAIRDGFTHTGITIMRTALAVDSGEIILQKEIPIGSKETAGELFDRMAVLGAYALLEALPSVLDGTAVYTPQIEENATFCRMMKKEEGLIDWSLSAKRLDCHIRAMNPWPSAYFMLDGVLFKVFEASLVSHDTVAQPGTVLAASAKEGLQVQVSDGVVRFDVIQPQGKARMKGADYLKGHTIPTGILLG